MQTYMVYFVRFAFTIFYQHKNASTATYLYGDAVLGAVGRAQGVCPEDAHQNAGLDDRCPGRGAASACEEGRCEEFGEG